jgi:hypothetical protein
MAKAADRLGKAPSNRQAFLCLQSVQAPKIITEFRPFAVILLTELDSYLDGYYAGFQSSNASYLDEFKIMK